MLAFALGKTLHLWPPPAPSKKKVNKTQKDQVFPQAAEGRGPSLSGEQPHHVGLDNTLDPCPFLTLWAKDQASEMQRSPWAVCRVALGGGLRRSHQNWTGSVSKRHLLHASCMCSCPVHPTHLCPAQNLAESHSDGRDWPVPHCRGPRAFFCTNRLKMCIPRDAGQTADVHGVSSLDIVFSPSWASYICKAKEALGKAPVAPRTNEQGYSGFPRGCSHPTGGRALPRAAMSSGKCEGG